MGSGDVQSNYSFTVEIQEAPQEEEPAGAIEDAPAGEGDLIEPAAGKTTEIRHMQAAE